MDLLDLAGLESVRPLIDNNIRQYKIFAKVLEGQDFCPQCGSHAQGAVSRMEKQSDFLLSTLRDYVGALGGQLELRVVFPDADFVIETLAPATSTRKRPVRAGVTRIKPGATKRR